MYVGGEFQSEISSAVYKYSQFSVGNSQDTRSKRSSYILAKWCGSNAQIDDSYLRPAKVLYYFKHSLTIQNSLQPHLFAAVEWFKPHASRNILGNPLEEWCHDLFEPLGPASYLPLRVQVCCSCRQTS
jgi:hypothetical protein